VPVREFVRGNPSVPVIAITFDAGAESGPTDAMLKALAERGLRSTFFLTGRWAEQNPDLVRRIAAEGHEIANHTYTHPDLRTLSDARVAEEISRTEALLVELTGQPVRPWFRFPFGARDARTNAAIARLGYYSIYWTLDSLDSLPPPKTPQFLHDRIVNNSVNGSIILVHVGSAPTAAALPRILDSLQARGFRLVTVSELLGL
jgi:peptidoglycan/xylan/chitin deacetylase (PgdA/CDA1 family)